MFACRELDMGQSYHVYDTSIDCNGESYRLMRVVAIVMMLVLPVGIPAAFGALLYRNRAALSGAADAEEEGAISFAVFRKTVKMIEPESSFSESALQALYKTIDADNSGGITLKEFVQHALVDARGGNGSDGTAQPEEVRAPTAGSQPTEEAPHHGLNQDDLSFLVRAFEPEFYCEQL